MPTESPGGRKGGSRVKPSQRSRVPALVVSIIVVASALVGLALASYPREAASLPAPTPAVSAAVPTPEPTPPPTPEPTPEPTPTPTPEPTPEPYDFTQPAPEAEAVEDDWFSDVVFIGDSRTDGLRLYGGVQGAAFLEHTGITVFEVGDKKVIRVDGKKYTVLEALALRQYEKVYLMLGVNELGYHNDKAFEDAYAKLVDDIRAIQPDAVLYLQTLVRINPEKARANNQPYYVTNDQIDVYNEIITRIAADKHAVLVDVNAALVDDTGVLPKEGTNDGVHFSKSYYVKWYEYLKSHTVDPDQYWAGQTETEGV